MAEATTESAPAAAAASAKASAEASAEDNPKAGPEKARSRGIRRTITGVVSSAAMDKTIVVTVVRRIRDRRFHKFVTRRVKYKAHDERNQCRVGDKVELVESRPYSRTKRWRVSRTLEKAREVIK